MPPRAEPSDCLPEVSGDPRVNRGTPIRTKPQVVLPFGLSLWATVQVGVVRTLGVSRWKLPQELGLASPERSSFLANEMSVPCPSRAWPQDQSRRELWRGRRAGEVSSLRKCSLNYFGLRKRRWVVPVGDFAVVRNDPPVLPWKPSSELMADVFRAACLISFHSQGGNCWSPSAGEPGSLCSAPLDAAVNMVAAVNQPRVVGLDVVRAGKCR